MDKLAMEEAGFRNCVSVPDGAPPCVSENDLPPKEKVCRDHFISFLALPSKIHRPLSFPLIHSWPYVLYSIFWQLDISSSHPTLVLDGITIFMCYFNYKS